MNNNAAAEVGIRLLIGLVFGAATAAIAVKKGRSGVGWFFLGFFLACIALIIILCLSDLAEEESRWSRMHDEQRRLREQLKQERLKNEAFQGHVRHRLDAHDTVLQMNTRQLEGGEGAGAAASLPVPEGMDIAPDTFQGRRWHVAFGTQQSPPMTFEELKQSYGAGRVQETNLIWTEGMKSWQPIAQVPGLVEALL